MSANSLKIDDDQSVKKIREPKVVQKFVSAAVDGVGCILIHIFYMKKLPTRRLLVFYITHFPMYID